MKPDTTALLHHCQAIKASVVHLVVGGVMFALFMGLCYQFPDTRFYFYLFGVFYASPVLAVITCVVQSISISSNHSCSCSVSHSI